MKAFLILIILLALPIRTFAQGDTVAMQSIEEECEEFNLDEMVKKSDVILLGKFTRITKYGLPNRPDWDGGGIKFVPEKTWKKELLNKNIIITVQTQNKNYFEIKNHLKKRGSAIVDVYFLIFTTDIKGMNGETYPNQLIITPYKCDGIFKLENMKQVEKITYILNKGDGHAAN